MPREALQVAALASQAEPQPVAAAQEAQESAQDEDLVQAQAHSLAPYRAETAKADLWSQVPTSPWTEPAEMAAPLTVTAVAPVSGMAASQPTPPEAPQAEERESVPWVAAS